jgi:hypothetical protein
VVAAGALVGFPNSSHSRVSTGPTERPHSVAEALVPSRAVVTTPAGRTRSCGVGPSRLYLADSSVAKGVARSDAEWSEAIVSEVRGFCAVRRGTASSRRSPLAEAGVSRHVDYSRWRPRTQRFADFPFVLERVDVPPKAPAVFIADG